MKKWWWVLAAGLAWTLVLVWALHDDTLSDAQYQSEGGEARR